MQYNFNVPDMSCQHCQMTIARALNKDAATKAVKVSLPDKTVSVESQTSRQELVRLIEETGYHVSDNEE